MFPVSIPFRLHTDRLRAQERVAHITRLRDDVNRERRSRPPRRSGAAAWSVLTATALLASALAGAAPSARAQEPGPARLGYAWSGSNAAPPVGQRYLAPPEYSSPFNDTYITRTAKGAYEVRFIGQASSGGVAHVTGYGTGAASCQVLSWFPSGADQQVNVRCSDRTGAPVNATFTVLYERATSPQVNHREAYLWNNEPTRNGEFTPATSYAYNGMGALPTITRQAVGQWAVRLPGMGVVSGGNAQVTPYGSTQARCQVSNWYPASDSQFVNVSCTTPTGAPLDTSFTLSFVDQLSMVGSSLDQAFAYGWVTPDGVPSQYQWSFDGSPPDSSSVRVAPNGGRGKYRVTMEGQFGYWNSHVQVSAYGTAGNTCKVVFWDAPTIDVACFGANGKPARSAFTFAYLGPVVPA